MNGSGLEDRRGFGSACFHLPAQDQSGFPDMMNEHPYDRRLISEAT